MKRFICVLAFIAVAMSAQAGVVSQGPSGFAVKYEADVALAPAATYEAFVKIGSWWGSDHTFSGDAKNMSMDVQPGGAWRETLPNGGFVEHMRVVEASPGVTLVLSGGLGPMHFMGITGTMTIGFIAKDAGTHVTMDFAGGGYDPEGFAKLPGIVDAVLGEQFARFTEFTAQ